MSNHDPYSDRQLTLIGLTTIGRWQRQERSALLSLPSVYFVTPMERF